MWNLRRSRLRPPRHRPGAARPLPRLWGYVRGAVIEGRWLLAVAGVYLTTRTLSGLPDRAQVVIALDALVILAIVHLALGGNRD